MTYRYLSSNRVHPGFYEEDYDIAQNNSYGGQINVHGTASRLTNIVNSWVNHRGSYYEPEPRGFFGRIWDGIKSFGSKCWNGIKSFFGFD